MAKDVKKQVAKEKTETQVAQDSQPEQTAQPAPQPKTTPLARASYNIAIHSLLMILIPFGLFFLSAYSFLDRKFDACFAHNCLSVFDHPCKHPVLDLLQPYTK